MTNKPKVTVEPFRGTVNVSFSDAMIASTDDAVLLREDGHDPVFYIPFRDIYFEYLTPSPTTYHCPLKGDARYWSVEAVGQAEDDVMWIYDQPPPQLSTIRQHGAFDPSKVLIQAVPESDLVHRPHTP